ncbi:alpha/beta hydrolase family protein [Aspergillus alliaceus]|uniref:alpha/beta hydrolase family protein n=1 Tax=Petromyces alliaceus TaxID=209559 RepID=UPI0012A4CF50|nr:Alpha/Beta hydrolase protein [Aspergillus alliaceus]KAB8231401.1 Alpha/Beta hydrolase protein [Aspergillus alliaceus]
MNSLSTFLLVAALATAYASTLDRASNYPVSPELAEEYDCEKSCQEYLNTTNISDLEDFDTPFDFDFYATADNFSSSKPGDVLKLVPVNPKLMNVPGGITTYKMQYTSVDLDNSTVPATAFIAFPYVYQADPYKLIAFAHGTSGVFRGCAPSTSSNFYDYDTWIPLLFTGYAVVGTDYVGLGNNYTNHKYIATKANANDIYWSVIAAKKAFPRDLSEEWVSIGHSQGGGASWKLSEQEQVQREESGYLGGVAVAPNTHIYNAVLEGLSLTEGSSGDELQGYGSSSYVPSLYFALRAVYPNYTAPFLSDLAKRRIGLGERAQLCAAALPAVLRDLDSSQILSNDTLNSLSAIKEFQDLNAPGQGDTTSRPLLVIVGGNDTTVYPSITKRAYEQSCEAGNSLQLSIYPGLEHSAVFGASAPEWLGFIDRLFRGRGLCECSLETMWPFDAPHARKPQE